MADRRCLQRVENPQRMMTAFFEPSNMAYRRFLRRVEILNKSMSWFLLSLYGGPSLPPAGRNPQHMKVLDFSSLCGGLSLPPAGRNPQRMRVFDLLSLHGGPSLPRAGRNPHKLKVLDFLSLYGGPSLPPAGRNPQKLKAWDFEVSMADCRCLRRVEILKK